MCYIQKHYHPSPPFSQGPGSTHLALDMYATSLFSFLVFYLRANTLWKSKGSSFTTAKNNDLWFYLFPVSGIECPVCTNVNGSGASKCDSGKVPTVTCPDGLDHCITLKGKMTVLKLTQDFEQKNCSNNASCDSASDYNGKNVTAKNFNPPPPLRERLPYKLHVGDAGRVFMV